MPVICYIKRLYGLKNMLLINFDACHCCWNTAMQVQGKSFSVLGRILYNNHALAIVTTSSGEEVLGKFFKTLNRPKYYYM